MTLRDALLPVFGNARGVIDDLGLRTHSVTVRRRTWTGPAGGKNSTFVDADLLLAPNPRVRQMNAREVSDSGGNYRLKDLRVDRITPSYGDGGYTEDQLRPPHGAPSAANPLEIYYVVAGPEAGDYQLVELRVDRNFGYAMILRRRNTTP